MERENKTREGRKKQTEKKKMHTEGGEEERHLTFLLSVGGKRKILKLIFNTINCSMKQHNLSC